MGFEALCAAISVRTTIAASFPLVRAGHALWLCALRHVGTLPVVMVWALAAVDVVLAGVATDVCAFVQRYSCVRRCPIALFAAGDELITCLASELSEPIPVFTLARAVPINRHVREDTILDITFAGAVLLDRQEV